MVSSLVVKASFFVFGACIGGVLFYFIRSITEGGLFKENGTFNTTGSRVKDSLKLVFVISRHGNRAGSVDYPLDPYPLKSTVLWPYGASALTPKGRVQEYNLGRKLRSMYDGYLPSMFSSQDIYASSDLYERVIMSGDLVLAGLYPPQGFQVWNDDVDWQPIALYTNSSDHSGVVSNCPKYVQEAQQCYNMFLERDAVNISALVSYMYDVSRETLSAEDLYYMFEKLISEDTEGYALPLWTKSLYPGPLVDFYGEMYSAIWGCTEEMVRLLTGNLLGEIVESINGKVNRSVKPERKLNYYSGHDTTIVSMQLAFGVAEPSIINIVKVGSALILELHEDQDSGDYSVQVLFVDGSLLDLDPVALYLSNCGDPCELHSFLNTTYRFTNVSYEQECSLTSLNFTEQVIQSNVSNILRVE